MDLILEDARGVNNPETPQRGAAASCAIFQLPRVTPGQRNAIIIYKIVIRTVAVSEMTAWRRVWVRRCLCCGRYHNTINIKFIHDMYVRRCTTRRRENTSPIRGIPGSYETPNNVKNKITVSTRISTETKSFRCRNTSPPSSRQKKTIFPEKCPVKCLSTSKPRRILINKGQKLLY